MADDSDAYIRKIAFRATPLWDRPLDSVVGYDTRSSLARRRLEHWQSLLGGAFAWDRRMRGFPRADAVAQLLAGVGGEPERAGLPEWALTLQAVLRYEESTADRQRRLAHLDPAFDRLHPRPFQEVLLPFIRYARHELRQRSGQVDWLLGPDAAIALARQLLSHLSFVASLALGQQFYRFRFDRAPASAIEAVWSQRRPSTEIYFAFVEHMRHGGFRAFLNEYPVLARLLSNSTRQWIQNSADLCTRLAQDLPDLNRLMGWGREGASIEITYLRTDLSDRHDGGQSVMEIGLAGSTSVIYKPRSVAPEEAYNHLIRWLNAQGIPRSLRTLKTLDRGDYGWMEVVNPKNCRSMAEVGDFYTRAGTILAVLYALSVSDIHCENLIADGGHPVVVDLETLLNSNQLGGAAADGARDARSGRFSVNSTGMLPRWQTAPDGHQFDMSSLCADDTQVSGIRGLAWLSVNTDAMRLVPDMGADVSLTHRPKTDDKLPSVRDHLPRLIEGFQTAWKCLHHGRDELRTDRTLSGLLDGIEVRTLLRSTTTYTRLQLRLLHPEFLQDGIDRSIELDWLARPLTGPVSPSADRVRVYDIERAAMESLDVPRFVSTEWRPGALDAGAELLLLYAPRDLNVLVRALDGMSHAECTYQVSLITEAIASRFAATP